MIYDIGRMTFDLRNLASDVLEQYQQQPEQFAPDDETDIWAAYYTLQLLVERTKSRKAA